MYLENEKLKTFASIDLEVLEDNYRLLSEKITKETPDCKLMCVVKANAYGHGIRDCVKRLGSLGVNTFGVSCIEEAREVRRCAPEGSDILILGFTPPEDAGELARDGYIQTVFSREYADGLSREAVRAGACVRVHIKADTGMNRIGFDASTVRAEDAAEEIISVMHTEGLCVEGIFTHFACADAEDTASAREQHEKFTALLEAMGEKKNGLCIHCCNSAAALRFPEFRHDMVRLGLVLYGLSPLGDMPIDIKLRPVMRFVTTVTHVHTLKAGESVSYGARFTADRDMRIATLGVGYADGFLRAFSNGGTVLIGGKPVSVVGSVCMDQCMVDIGDMDVRAGDEAVIFDSEGENIERLAAAANTISYELVCLVGVRVRRVISKK